MSGSNGLIAWPLYAEHQQRLNMVVLVKGLKLALAINELEYGLVSAA